MDLYVQTVLATDYPQKLWKSTLTNLLKGTPRSIARMYNKTDPGATFRELRTHLESKCGIHSSQYTKAMFHAARRKDKQPFEDYTSDLSVLGFKAFSDDNYTVEQIESRVLEHFCNTMQGSLGKELRLRIPATVNEAVAVARNLDLQGFSDRSNGVVAAVGSRGRGRGRAVARGARTRATDRTCYSCGRQGQGRQGLLVKGSTCSKQSARRIQQPPGWFQQSWFWLVWIQLQQQPQQQQQRKKR